MISRLCISRQRTHRIAVKNISLLVRADMAAVQEHFPIHDGAPRILQVAAPLPQGFDLGAEELDAGLEAFLPQSSRGKPFVLRNRSVFCFATGSPPLSPCIRISLYYKNAALSTEFRQSKLLLALNRTRKRDLIHIFQIAADRNAVSKARHTDAERL